MASYRIIFDEEDVEFMKDYKDSHGIYIQKFVIEAVKEKIAKIKAMETIRNMELIRKK